MAGLNLFDMLTSGAGKSAMQQLSQQFGIDEQTTQAAVKSLLPALSGGLKRNVQAEGGLQALLGALETGAHDQYLDQPARLTADGAVVDGNAILGHLLGSKDTSRAVASKASARSGVSEGMLKSMLPVVATMAMGAISKQMKEPSIQEAVAGAMSGQALGGQAQGGALGGLLGGLLGGANSRSKATAEAANAQSGGANMLGVLGGLLDADGDGSPFDDIMELVMKR